MRFFAILIAALVPLGGLGYYVADSAAKSMRFDVPTLPGRDRPQGGFYVGDFQSVEHLNPFTSQSAVTHDFVLRYTHDGLMRLDEETRRLEPAVARLVESSADLLTHTFALREGVVFSDGRPVTLDDIRFTFDVSRDAAVQPGALHEAMQMVAAFVAEGSDRFRLILKEPHFNGIAMVARGYTVLQRRWFLDRVAIEARKLGLPVPAGAGEPGFGKLLNRIQLPGPGTGPYRIARDGQGAPVFRRDRELWLVQNTKSWHRNDAPRRWNLGGFGLRFVGGEPVTRLKAEQTDWSLPMNPAEFLAANPELTQKYEVHRYDAANNGPWAISWNCERLPVEVRRVLARLFDREFIKETILGGSAQVVDSFFRPTDPECPKGTPVKFDVAGARRDLAKLGYGPGGKALTVRIIADDGARGRRILESAARTFREAGVTLKAALLESKAFLAAIEAGEFEGVLSYWVVGQLSVDPYIYYHSSGAFNDGGYRDPEVDKLLEAARRELDVEKRAAIYQRFHAIVQRDQPLTTLVRPINTLLLHRRFQGVEIGPLGAVPGNWWVEPKDRLHPVGRSR